MQAPWAFTPSHSLTPLCIHHTHTYIHTHNRITLHIHINTLHLSPSLITLINHPYISYGNNNKYEKMGAIMTHAITMTLYLPRSSGNAQLKKSMLGSLHERWLYYCCRLPYIDVTRFAILQSPPSTRPPITICVQTSNPIVSFHVSYWAIKLLKFSLLEQVWVCTMWLGEKCV